MVSNDYGKYLRACTVKAVATARPTASGFCGTVWGSDRKTDVTVWPTSRLRAASGATFNCLDEPRRAYMIGGIDAENCQQDCRMSSAASWPAHDNPGEL